jgi:cell division septum initiation protein DivIVA
MSVHSEHRSPEAPPDPAPRLEDIPFAAHGLDPDRVSESFQAFERQLSWYRARQGTTLPAVPAGPAGADLRADAMRLIRAAVEFADVVERDAQEVACQQVEQAAEAIRRREAELEEREAALRSGLADLERRRASMILAARREAEEIVAAAMHESTELRREAEAARVKIVEECRHHATDLANASRADVEQTLEWARAQAEAIVRRGRAVAEQLLAASLRGQGDVARVVDAIVRAAEAQAGEPPETAGPVLTALPPGSTDRFGLPPEWEPADDLADALAAGAGGSRTPGAPIGATPRPSP